MVKLAFGTEMRISLHFFFLFLCLVFGFNFSVFKVF